MTRRRGGVKRRETNLASNQFPKSSPWPRTPKKFTELSREEKGREEIEVTWWRKRRVQRGREQSRQ